MAANLTGFYYDLSTHRLTEDMLKYCSECETTLKKCYNFKSKCTEASRLLAVWEQCDEKDRPHKVYLHTELGPPNLQIWTRKNIGMYYYNNEPNVTSNKGKFEFNITKSENGEIDSMIMVTNTTNAKNNDATAEKVTKSSNESVVSTSDIDYLDVESPIKSTTKGNPVTSMDASLDKLSSKDTNNMMETNATVLAINKNEYRTVGSSSFKQLMDNKIAKMKINKDSIMFTNPANEISLTDPLDIHNSSTSNLLKKPTYCYERSFAKEITSLTECKGSDLISNEHCYTKGKICEVQSIENAQDSKLELEDSETNEVDGESLIYVKSSTKLTRDPLEINVKTEPMKIPKSVFNYFTNIAHKAKKDRNHVKVILKMKKPSTIPGTSIKIDERKIEELVKNYSCVESTDQWKNMNKHIYILQKRAQLKTEITKQNNIETVCMNTNNHTLEKDLPVNQKTADEKLIVPYEILKGNHVIEKEIVNLTPHKRKLNEEYTELKKLKTLAELANVDIVSDTKDSKDVNKNPIIVTNPANEMSFTDPLNIHNTSTSNLLKKPIYCLERYFAKQKTGLTESKVSDIISNEHCYAKGKLGEVQSIENIKDSNVELNDSEVNEVDGESLVYVNSSTEVARDPLEIKKMKKPSNTVPGTYIKIDGKKIEGLVKKKSTYESTDVREGLVKEDSSNESTDVRDGLVEEDSCNKSTVVRDGLVKKVSSYESTDEWKNMSKHMYILQKRAKLHTEITKQNNIGTAFKGTNNHTLEENNLPVNQKTSDENQIVTYEFLKENHVVVKEIVKITPHTRKLNEEDTELKKLKTLAELANVDIAPDTKDCQDVVEMNETGTEEVDRNVEDNDVDDDSETSEGISESEDTEDDQPPKIQRTKIKYKLKKVFNKFAADIPATSDGYQVNKNFILCFFENMSDDEIWQLQKVLIHVKIKKYDFSKNLLNLLAKLQQKYESRYLYIFDFIYFNTDEEILREFENRKTYPKYVNSEHKCVLCRTQYNSLKILVFHMKCHKPEYGDYECDICHVRRTTSLGLKRHRKSHQVVFKCKICPLITNNKCDMLEHALEHQGHMFICEVCGRTYTTDTAYKKHKHKKHNNYVCDICANGYATQANLDAHKRLKHPHTDMSHSTEQTLCGQCNIMFFCRAVYSRHAAKAHGEKLHRFTFDKQNSVPQMGRSVRRKKCVQMYTMDQIQNLDQIQVLDKEPNASVQTTYIIKSTDQMNQAVDIDQVLDMDQIANELDSVDRDDETEYNLVTDDAVDEKYSVDQSIEADQDAETAELGNFELDDVMYLEDDLVYQTVEIVDENFIEDQNDLDQTTFIDKDYRDGVKYVTRRVEESRKANRKVPYCSGNNAGPNDLQDVPRRVSDIKIYTGRRRQKFTSYLDQALDQYTENDLSD